MVPMEDALFILGMQPLVAPYLACPQLTANDHVILGTLAMGLIVSRDEIREGMPKVSMMRLRERMEQVQAERPDLPPLGVLNVQAQGYVLSPVNTGPVFLPQLLNSADRAVIRNSQLGPPEKILLQALFEQATAMGTDAVPLFSPRERDVLLCLAANYDRQLPVSDVATTLATSPGTVVQRVHEIKPKLREYSCGEATIGIGSNYNGYWLMVNCDPSHV